MSEVRNFLLASVDNQMAASKLGIVGASYDKSQGRHVALVGCRFITTPVVRIIAQP